jgi:tRNA(Ile2) C34 agmatinyltransferase TiaS
MEEILNCPKCKTTISLTKIERAADGYDYEYPNCHRKFELLSMEIKRDKHGNVKRHYKLRSERIIKESKE